MYLQAILREKIFMIQHSGATLPVLGVTVAIFASGFGVCMFNLDTVGSCLSLAGGWVAKFQMMCDHIIAWAMKMMQGIKGIKP